VLATLTPARRKEWVNVFAETKGAWRYGYLRLGDGCPQPWSLDDDDLPPVRSHHSVLA
jgi:hypothetical protein